MENTKQTYIQSLSSYHPIGRQIVLKEVETEPRTKHGVSMGKMKKYLVAKLGSEVEFKDLVPEDVTGSFHVYVVLADRTPVLSLTTGVESFLQVDSAYIIGTETLNQEIVILDE